MRRLIVAFAMLAGTVLPVLPETFQKRVTVCLACHGEKGQSETAQVPSLGAMPSAYLLIQLYLFRENQRRVDPMNDMAKGMTDADLQTFADFIEKLPRPKMEQAPDQARMERARALVAQHRCGFCHSPDYSGHDNIPRLAAQREDYLLKALREYKSNARVGYDTAMIEVVQPLKDADLVELAYFMAHSP